MRQPREKLLLQIDSLGPRHLPCPKRKDHAQIAVEVCTARCPYARKCPVYQRWLRPTLGLLADG